MAVKPKEIAFSGRLITADDPSNITGNDFRELKNMRYGNKAPRGVGGCTKYNTSALASTGLRNGMHLRRGNGESHVMAATSDGKIWRNGTAIGTQGDFASALWSTAGQTTPRFTAAPQDALVACDGVNTLVWCGTEFRCAGFVDYPSTDNVYDYSEEVTNSLTSSDQLATIHTATSSIDANTMLLLHFDNDVTDSSPTTAHTVTNNGATYVTPSFKHGTHNISLDGTNDYLTIPDNADFDFSAGTWTIDFWFYPPSGCAVGKYIYYHGTDADNYMYIKTAATGPNTRGIEFGIVSAASTVVTLSGGGYQSTAGSGGVWAIHIAVVENGDNYYLFLNGQIVDTASDTDRTANYTGLVYIGSDSTPANYLTGYLDEFRISNSARWTSAFTPSSGPYGTGYSSTTYIGSILPLDGFKAYVSTANDVASTMAVNEWDGNGWSALSITDNTASGGISLGQTGTVTWASTASTSKPKIIEKTLLYWYQVVITAPYTFSAVLSQVTVSVPMQQLKELWDGAPRSLTAFIGVKSGAFYDYTSNVFEDFIDSANTYTWAAIGQYTASDYLLLGSTEQLMGVILNLADIAINTNDMIASVSYWDGAAWQAVVVDDSTKSGTKSFAKSGMITWTAPTKNAEHKQTTFSSHTGMENIRGTIPAGVQGGGNSRLFYSDGTPADAVPQTAELRRSSFPSYYYKITFSATLSGSDANGVKVYYAAGIPAPQPITGYTFAVEHQGSLWLFDNYDGKRNSYMASAPDTLNVFNGRDSFASEIGGGDPPLAAASLMTKTGVAVQDTLVIPKANDTYIISGTSPSDYVQRKLKGNVGIAAPLTMVVIPLGDESIQGITRSICMWVATQGVISCDGYASTLVSADIEDKFDPMHPNYVGASALKASTAFYDPVYDAFVWCIGGSTTWRFDLKRKKWYEVPMSSNTRLYGGFPVVDANGISHAYGFGNTGYVWYLDNGNDFDGDAIAQSFHTADIALENNYIGAETFVRQFKLVQKAKANTANSVTITHYGDSRTSGNVIATYSPAASGKRLNDRVTTGRFGPHIFHSWKAELSTDDEPLGFEPLMASINYELVRLDTRG